MVTISETVVLALPELALTEVEEEIVLALPEDVVFALPEDVVFTTAVVFPPLIEDDVALTMFTMVVVNVFILQVAS
jgi:hypothetical protein